MWLCFAMLLLNGKDDLARPVNLKLRQHGMLTNNDLNGIRNSLKSLSPLRHKDNYDLNSSLRVFPTSTLVCGCMAMGCLRFSAGDTFALQTIRIAALTHATSSRGYPPAYYYSKNGD